MTLVLSSSGSTLLVTGTEVTLYNPTTVKRFDGYVDLTPMASGDTIEIRVYVQIDTLGSYRQYNVQTFTDAQTTYPLLYIPMLPSDIGWKLTAKQITGGTARTLTWRIYEVA